MNPVAMTVVNPRKEYWPSRGSNHRPPILKSATLPTELWGSPANALNFDKCVFVVWLTLYQTTNFRLFQTERVCRRQFQIKRKWQKVIQTGKKQSEKEKLLVTSNFSFSHSVFKRLVSQGRQKVSLCGNGLRVNPLPQNVAFWLT